jgi:Recombination directionality factor-like
MPILDLQMRLRQLGEIRIGHVVPTGRTRKDGKPGTRPAKLDKFRFTSPSREILAGVAKLYGGEVQPWTPANGGPDEFEVYSQVNRLPVLIPPRDAVSQWYELYAGSKCQRRCDGVTEHKQDRPCVCNPDKRDCKITTRVNVMLRDLPAMGQWLLISKGYHAGTTLPPAAELLARAQKHVEGWLGMEEKLVQTDDGPVRFMVPTLDVDITPAALMAGHVTSAAAVASGTEGRPAIEAGPSQQQTQAGPPRDFLQEAKEAATRDDVLVIFQAAKAAGRPVPYQEQIRAIGMSKPAVAAQPEVDHSTEHEMNPADYGDASEEQIAEFLDGHPVHEAEIVDDGALEEIWFQIIAAAGTKGWTTEATEQKFAARNGGLMPATASVEQLRGFLAAVKAGEVA